MVEAQRGKAESRKGGAAEWRSRSVGKRSGAETSESGVVTKGFPLQRQDNWYSLLPLAEFSYNNHVHSSTQQTPFLLDTGRHPRMGFEPHQPPSKVEAVNEFTDRMKSALEEAKSALAKAKDDMARYYNQRRTPAPVYVTDRKS